MMEERTDGNERTKGASADDRVCTMRSTKETALERADFIFPLLLFVNADKGGENVCKFLSFQFSSAFVPTV